MNALLELQTRISAKKNSLLVGKELRVLVYGPSDTDPGVVECRTEGGKILLIPGGAESEPGSFVRVRVTDAGAFRLNGEVIKKEE